MSLISMDIPKLPASTDDMKDFINFVYMRESLLKHYGAIKIIPPSEIKGVLKKNRVKLMTPSTTQQVTQLNQHTMIYSVDTVPYDSANEPKQLSSIDETAFWSLLSCSPHKQQTSSVSILPNASFFRKRVHRADFNIHRLPHRSLLTLCESKCLDQFVSSLTRAHGYGVIFPLASTSQRLFSLNYHHEGGLRYWYIIPASERETLQRAVEEETPSTCLEHNQILINPIVFDKYKIRYHRLVQHPNEIVVLAAGSLSQSFTTDAAWSETIDFALPSWLSDGHASAQISCKCELPRTSLSKMIDINSFSKNLVQQYIKTYLNVSDDSKSASDTSEQDSPTDEESSSNNTSLICLEQSSREVVTSPIIGNFFEDEDFDDKNSLNLFKIDDISFGTPNESTYYTASYQSQTSSTSSRDLYQISSSQDFYRQMMSESTSDSRSLSVEEIMDLIATPPTTDEPTESMSTELVGEHSTVQQTLSNHASSVSMNTDTMCTPIQNISKKKHWNNTRNANKTLCISGMRNGITVNDIRHHFVGCAKVVMKQSQLPPHSNYAFVYYRSIWDVEYNRKRPINYQIFGSDCHVEYVNSQPSHSSKQQICETWNLVVRQIPEHITEERLRNLFIGCHSMKYIPARTVNNMNASAAKNKLLWGYAFLYYTNAEQAANVVKNAEKIQINDRPLVISFYDKMKTTSMIRQTLRCPSGH